MLFDEDNNASSFIFRKYASFFSVLTYCCSVGVFWSDVAADIQEEGKLCSVFAS